MGTKVAQLAFFWLPLTRHCCPTGTVVDGALALSMHQHARLLLFTRKLYSEREPSQDLAAFR